MDKTIDWDSSDRAYINTDSTNKCKDLVFCEGCHTYYHVSDTTELESESIKGYFFTCCHRCEKYGGNDEENNNEKTY